MQLNLTYDQLTQLKKLTAQLNTIDEQDPLDRLLQVAEEECWNPLTSLTPMYTPFVLRNDLTGECWQAIRLELAASHAPASMSLVITDNGNLETTSVNTEFSSWRRK